jgi:hypothetical protein
MIYEYYMAHDNLALRRIDTSEKVEIFWMASESWVPSVVRPQTVRRGNRKISEGKAMEYVSNIITENNAVKAKYST